MITASVMKELKEHLQSDVSFEGKSKKKSVKKAEKLYFTKLKKIYIMAPFYG